MIRTLMAALLLAQTTGAADLAPMLARGAMLPPPARIAPLPRPTDAAKPSGESWLQSARLVAAWARESLKSEPPLPAAPAEPAPQPAAEAVAAPVVAERPADRMLIAMNGARVLASGGEVRIADLKTYAKELKPVRARFQSARVKEGVLSVRVDYLKPFGVTKGEKDGFTVKLADGIDRWLPRPGVPGALRREFPVYFAHDKVTIELSLRNEGAEPLRGVTVAAVQEVFAVDGRPGRPIGAPRVVSAPDLAPGEERTVRWTIRLGAGEGQVVNFEQTHLVVRSRDAAGLEKLQLDQAQAGVVDPPNL